AGSRRIPADELRGAHTANIDLLEFSSCGSLLLTASRSDSDRRVKIWELVSGELLLDVLGGQTGSLSATLSPRGEWLAVGSDREVKLFAMEGLRELCYAAVQPFEVHALAFSPQGTLFTLAPPPNPSRELLFWTLSLPQHLHGHRLLPGPTEP